MLCQEVKKFSFNFRNVPFTCIFKVAEVFKFVNNLVWLIVNPIDVAFIFKKSKSPIDIFKVLVGRNFCIADVEIFVARPQEPIPLN